MRALALAPLLLLPTCGGETPTAPAPPRAAVTAVPVVMASVQQQVEVPGRVRPRQFVDLVARVAGELTEVAFDFGAAVEPGARLFQIDRVPYEIAVASAEANVQSAESLWKQAEQYRERLEGVRKGGVPENDIQTARLEEQRLLAQLDAARAQLARAELELSWTTIRAPIAGRVGRTDLAPGDQVGPSSGTLVRINQVEPMEAAFFVPEGVFQTNEAQRRRAGMSASDSTDLLAFELAFIDGTVYDQAGKTSYVSPEVDVATGTIEIRALFPNPDGVLLSNQFVTVMIEVGDALERPVVPRIAVLRDRSGDTVLVARNDGSYERREVTLGPELGRSVAVLDGVTEGELVITEGLDRIRPGSLLAVEVVDPGAVSAQPANDED